jgi:hypothetical protein
MDILINLANVIYVVAYFTTNIVRLRVLTLVAATCLAFYFFNQPVPMLNVVAWNVGFILLNLVQLLRLLDWSGVARSMRYWRIRCRA